MKWQDKVLKAAAEMVNWSPTVEQFLYPRTWTHSPRGRMWGLGESHGRVWPRARSHCALDFSGTSMNFHAGSFRFSMEFTEVEI